MQARNITKSGKNRVQGIHLAPDRVDEQGNIISAETNTKPCMAAGQLTQNSIFRRLFEDLMQQLNGNIKNRRGDKGSPWRRSSRCRKGMPGTPLRTQDEVEAKDTAIRSLYFCPNPNCAMKSTESKALKKIRRLGALPGLTRKTPKSDRIKRLLQYPA